MKYVVLLKDYESGLGFFLGFTNDPELAKRYRDFKYKTVKKRHSKKDFEISILQFSENVFEREREINPDLGRCSELFEIDDTDVVISDDDYDFIEMTLNDKVADLLYHLREASDTLKFYEDNCTKARKLRKMCKEMIKFIDHDHEGDKFYDKVNYDYASKEITL